MFSIFEILETLLVDMLDDVDGKGGWDDGKGGWGPSAEGKAGW